jgi:vitamin B12 transporter
MKKDFFVVAAIIISSQLQAQVVTQQQEDSLTKSLEEVVLTASKTRLKQSQTGKVVIVIDQKTIANNIGRTISELLNTQAGIFINGANNNFGTNTDIYLRGAGSGNTLIVVDGIPVYDPSAPTSKTFDFNNISLDQIERIEILKGGQSTLWGSDAIAGVVQIFLKKNTDKKIAVTGSVAYGSFNTFRGNIGVNGSLNKLGYRLQYGYTGTDGISVAYDSVGNKGFDDDEFKQHTILAELNYQLNDALSIRLFENFSTYKAGLDAAAFTDDKDYTTRNKNNLTGAAFKYNRNKLTWNFLGSYQRMSRLTVDDSSDISSPWANYSKGNYSGSTINLESFINHSFTNKVELVAGLQYINQYSDQSYLSVSSFGPFESKIGKDSVKINHYSAYASLLLKDLSHFNLELGGRYNHHSLYGSNGTFTFNPSYVFDAHSKIFINISSGYRIPTLYQLYSEYGNKDLKPERSITYEIGLQTASDDEKIGLRLVAFKRDSKNLIAFGAANYVNRDEQNDYGFEVESRVALNEWGTWVNNLAFIDGRGVENNIKVQNLYRRPNFTLNSALTLSPVSRLVLIPSFRYVGNRLKNPFDFGPSEQPHYYTIDFFTSYSIKKIKLFIDLRNITDQQYFDIVGYNSKRFNMMGGLSFNF